MKLEEFKNNKLEIVEIFKSISGEGISAGEIVAFVRVAGCNLRCSYCDTKYSYIEDSSDNLFLYPQEIVDTLNELEVKKVICTGGEPLEVDKVKRYLPIYLAKEGFEVRIESNGSCPIYTQNEMISFSYNKEFKLNYTLDVKSPSSGVEEEKFFKDNLLNLSLGDELKFVVGNQADLDYSITFLERHAKVLAKNKVIINFSPIFGVMEEGRLVEFLLNYNSFFLELGLKTRLSLQIHKVIWVVDKRGV